ncbi:MAG: hypothetical protein Q9214_001197 [Letrouitia sp. 1 TL-2023]
MVYGSVSDSAVLNLLSTSPDDQFLQFDDIPTVLGLANVTRPYHHLAFSAYNVFTPRDPAFKDRITEHDFNCAVSSPNALIGSRDNPDPKHRSKGAYFGIENKTDMQQTGLLPYFTLLSFNIKPMDAPLPGTLVSVKGYRQEDEEQPHLEWRVDFPSGYHLPLAVKMQEYSREKWEKLHGVEIVADFGEDKLDWEFCLDDLEVQFFKAENQEVGIPWLDQIILEDHHV